MRNAVHAIRFFALLLVVIVAFLVTPTFDLKPLAALIPADFIADSALFTTIHRWITDDLARFALLLTGCAALTFGLLATPWPVEHTAPFLRNQGRYDRHTQLPSRGRRKWAGGFLLFLTGFASIAMLISYWNSGEEPPFFHGIWVGSILLFLIAAGLLNKQPHRSPHIHQQNLSGTTRGQVTIGWSKLLIFLLIAILIYGWKLTSLPATIDEETVRIGLRALETNLVDQVRLFASLTDISQPDEPLFALTLLPTVLFMKVTNDLLLSTRLAGVLAALLCTLGIWLVSVELFARRSDPVDEYVPIEDDGHSLVTVATTLLITNMALLYFSRQPIVLMANAWGTLGCWALLRGIRQSDRLAIGLSGVMLGFGIVFHSGAVAFGVTALLWWLGFGVVRLGLLPHRAPHQAIGLKQTVEDTEYDESPILYSSDFLLWLLGLLLVILPFLSPLAQAGRLWLTHFPIALSTSLLTLFSSLAPPILTYPAPLLNVILLPLIPLAIGVLIFNFDRRQGWLLVSWLLSTVGIISMQHQTVISWAHLLPLVPATILAMTFALDRLRVTLLRVGGRWLHQLLNFLLFGLVLWIAFQNGITYYTFAYQQSDMTSALGHLLREREQGQTAVIIQQAIETPIFTAEDPLLYFLTTGAIDQPAGNTRFVNEIPVGLSSGTLLIVPQHENSWLPIIESAYPNGNYHVQRDYYANPLFYLYIISDD